MFHSNRFIRTASLALSCAVLSLAVPSLYGQEAPSLADLARQARAAKNTGAHTAPGSGSPAAAPAAPVSPQSAASATSDKQRTAANVGMEPDARPNGMDLHFIASYEIGILKLFEQEKFDSIDQLAGTARSTRARLPGGYWTLHVIYDPLMVPAKGTYDASAD